MHATDALMDERELVLRLIDGDEGAFCELYAAYKKRLLYFAMKFVKSHEFAEDIFQDAFTVVWQSRHFINPDASFSSYLYTIVRNRILNQIRDITNEEQLRRNILSQAVDVSNETSNQVLFHDLQELIGRALEKLTPRQREVFNMSRDLQMSHKEIAEALGISVNTVQEHLSLSLKVIRSYLVKYSDRSADLLLILFCLNL
ncbi:RNA polymerase sigma-70 factor [Dysgonomonas sp. 511]|uniref:RNA polymerase sigma-70 factor n=1 Tax=Dysgonomonas sp. 511 TaxID=2302930 RepID=UPI0013D40B30|nr:RNA polymerase sigma-70 factor [Dysgonomonas sp. 511]NDV79414.1 RNA polymerase sigma-70 factor [Dysgonomonas sp. 511]